MKHMVPLLFTIFFSFANLCFAGTVANVPKGVAQCREVENICRNAGITTTQSNLVSSVSSLQNDFPFNISADFPSHKASGDNISEAIPDKTRDQEKLLVVISQEDCLKEPELFANLLNILSAENHNYDIKILFSYDENVLIPNFQTISGTKDFLAKLENSQDYAVLILSFNDDKTKVISGSGNLVSPSWIVRLAYDSINKNRLLSSFNASYISFIYKHNLFHDERLEEFLKAGLPAVHVHMGPNLENASIEGFFRDFLQIPEDDSVFSLDNHSIMVTIFHKSIWINEKAITKLILIIIYLAIFLLICYGFFNGNLRLQAWRHIKKIWFYPALILLVSIGIFFSYKGLLFNLEKYGIKIPTYTSIKFILPMNLTIISYIFIASLRYTPTFRRRTVDFMTLICASINLFLFPLFDITLFPIFAAEFILAWASTIFTRNIFHICILFLFEVPFLPFLTQLFGTADPVLLSELLKTNNYIPVALYLLLLPQYLNCFRVLTGINFYWLDTKKNRMSNDRKNLLIMAIFLISFELILSYMLPSYLKEDLSHKNDIVLMESPEHFISASLQSEQIFGDTISNIRIKSSKNLSFCDVRIKGEHSNPVLFSDNDSFSEDSKTTVFRLPYYPPNTLSFTYGANISENAEIQITGVYEEDGVYYSQKVILHSEASSDFSNINSSSEMDKL